MESIIYIILGLSIIGNALLIKEVRDLRKERSLYLQEDQLKDELAEETK